MANQDDQYDLRRTVWNSKENSEIDMTTTGSSLAPERLPIYADRLLGVGRGTHYLISNIIDAVQDNDLRYASNKFPEALKTLIRSIEELEASMQEIIVEVEDRDVKHEKIIKELVAKLEKYEVITLLDAFALPLIPKGRHCKVVDLASGIGRFLDYFSSNFKEVVQIDFLEKNVKKSKEMNPSRLSSYRFSIWRIK